MPVIGRHGRVARSEHDGDEGRSLRPPLPPRAKPLRAKRLAALSVCDGSHRDRVRRTASRRQVASTMSSPNPPFSTRISPRTGWRVERASLPLDGFSAVGKHAAQGPLALPRRPDALPCKPRTRPASSNAETACGVGRQRKGVASARRVQDELACLTLRRTGGPNRARDGGSGSTGCRFLV